jgi:hypothetical protein
MKIRMKVPHIMKTVRRGSNHGLLVWPDMVCGSIVFCHWRPDSSVEVVSRSWCARCLLVCEALVRWPMRSAGAVAYFMGEISHKLTFGVRTSEKTFSGLQADRGCAAVASFWGGKGAFGQKRMLRSAGYGFPRRKKSSASLQYCKCINRQ